MARIHGLKLVGPRLEVGSKIKNQGLVKTSKKSILGSDGPILDSDQDQISTIRGSLGSVLQFYLLTLIEYCTLMCHKLTYGGEGLECNCSSENYE